MKVDNLCYVLTEMSRNFIKNHKEDVLIDLPRMLKMNEAGEVINAFPREFGFDLDKRYFDCLKCEGGKEHTFSDALEYAKHSLGMDYVVRIHTDSGLVEVLVVKGTREKANDFITGIRMFGEFKDARIVDTLE